MCTQEDLLSHLRTNHGFDLTMESSFLDHDFDSLTIVEVVMSVEEIFDVEIHDEDIDKIKTVNDLYCLIQDLS